MEGTIKLKEDKKTWSPPGRETKPIVDMFPYYKSNRSHAKYYHRIRYANKHISDGKIRHVSFNMWCGQNGFWQEKGRVFSELPEGAVLCATCEGRAIGAGEDGSREINGRAVMYSPRKI